MPEPAAAPQRAPLLCLWPQRILFIGTLGLDAPHRHAAAVCLVGLDGGFRVREPGGDWLCGDSAIVPAGCTHVLDARGIRIAVFYNDPHRLLHPRMAARAESRPLFDLPRAAALREALRRLDEGFDTASARAALEAALSGALGRFDAPPRIDARVHAAIAHIEARLSSNDSIADLAAAVGLSPSRLQHLFLDEVGVPLRRLRIWIRLRAALERITAGADLTTAALDAGFAGSPHFSHTFKAMFGVAAARVLSPRTGVRFRRMS